MWFFGSKKKYTTMVRCRPPVLGTFQEHCKVLKQLLPSLTKEEIALAKEYWSKSETVGFLTTISEDKAHQIISKHKWPEEMIRDVHEPLCNCGNYYASPCCGGLNIGVHTRDVMGLELPDSLFTRGSFMYEITTNKPIELTDEEIKSFISNDAEVSGKRPREIRRAIEEGF